jgi:competence protein ComEA
MKKLLFALFALFAAVQLAFAAVNINTATEAELDKLPGVGPAKAKAIVEDRKKNGPFKTTDDLKRVKGIGDKNFEALKGEITIGGAPAAPKVDAKPAATPAPAAKKDDAKKDAKK